MINARHFLACAATACVPLLAAQAAHATDAPLSLVYTPGNTNPASNQAIGVEVSGDGRKLTVHVGPVDGYAGGRLNFGGYPYYVSVADFAPYGGTPQAATGDRYRGTGPLALPKGVRYTAAKLTQAPNVYRLTPVALSGIVRGYTTRWTGTMTGTITTDGTRGPLAAQNIVDFDIHVDGTQTTP